MESLHVKGGFPFFVDHGNCSLGVGIKEPKAPPFLATPLTIGQAYPQLLRAVSWKHLLLSNMQVMDVLSGYKEHAKPFLKGSKCIYQLRLLRLPGFSTLAEENPNRHANVAANLFFVVRGGSADIAK